MKSSNIFSVIPDFLKFIYRPNCEKSGDSFGMRIQKLMLLFVSIFIIRVIFIFTSDFFISTPLKEHINTPELKILILSCSLVPFIEEIAFRLPLLFSPLNLSLSTSILSFYLINSFFPVENQYDTGNYFILRILMAVMICIVVWFGGKKYNNYLKDLYGSKLYLIVYAYSLVFALMHIGNYDVDSKLMLSYVCIVLPVFMSSLLYSFARLKYDFSYSLSLHIINNLIPTIIVFTI